MHLINNEVENLRSVEQLGMYLSEIEQQLFGPVAQTASEPQSKPPVAPGIVHRLEGLQEETRNGLNQLHNLVQRLREKTGVVEVASSSMVGGPLYRTEKY